MKQVPIKQAGYSGVWEVPGYIVPDTDGSIAVCKTFGSWSLTHVPTGYGLPSLMVANRADGIEAAQCFYRACMRIKIDLRRKRKKFDKPQHKYLAKACAKWFSPMRAVG